MARKISLRQDNELQLCSAVALHDSLCLNVHYSIFICKFIILFICSHLHIHAIFCHVNHVIVVQCKQCKKKKFRIKKNVISMTFGIVVGTLMAVLCISYIILDNECLHTFVKKKKH